MHLHWQSMTNQITPCHVTRMELSVSHDSDGNQQVAGLGWSLGSPSHVTWQGGRSFTWLGRSGSACWLQLGRGGPDPVRKVPAVQRTHAEAASAPVDTRSPPISDENCWNPPNQTFPPWIRGSAPGTRRLAVTEANPCHVVPWWRHWDRSFSAEVRRGHAFLQPRRAHPGLNPPHCRSCKHGPVSRWATQPVQVSNPEPLDTIDSDHQATKQVNLRATPGDLSGHVLTEVRVLLVSWRTTVGQE